MTVLQKQLHITKVFFSLINPDILRSGLLLSEVKITGVSEKCSSNPPTSQHSSEINRRHFFIAGQILMFMTWKKDVWKHSAMEFLLLSSP